MRFPQTQIGCVVITDPIPSHLIGTAHKFAVNGPPVRGWWRRAIGDRFGSTRPGGLFSLPTKGGLHA